MNWTHQQVEQHSAAAAGAYRQLSEAKKQQVDNLKEKYKLEANPLEVQQKWVMLVPVHMMPVSAFAWFC